MIAGKVSRKFAWKSYIKEFLIYLVMIAGTLALAAIMVFIWFTADLQE